MLKFLGVAISFLWDLNVGVFNTCFFDLWKVEIFLVMELFYGCEAIILFELKKITINSYNKVIYIFLKIFFK